MSPMIKCSKCKATVRMDYIWTDYFRACCPFQHLVNDTRICFNCLLQTVGKENVNQRYEPQSKLWTQKEARFARISNPAAELRGIL